MQRPQSLHDALTHTCPGWHIEVYAKAAQWPSLLPQLEATGCKICIDHFGVPNGEPSIEESMAGFKALLEAGSRNPNLHAMLSGDFRFSDDEGVVRELAAQLLAAFGPSRVIWASDFPFTRYEQCGLSAAEQLAKLRRWVPDESAREQILSENPRGLFGFGCS